MSVQVLVLDEAEAELEEATRRFPYSIVFVAHRETLWVVAFAHQHRRPGYWRNRPGASSS